MFQDQLLGNLIYLKSQTVFITNLFWQTIQSDIERDNRNNFLINLNNNLLGAAVQVRETLGKLLSFARTAITTTLAKITLLKDQQLLRDFFLGVGG